MSKFPFLHAREIFFFLSQKKKFRFPIGPLFSLAGQHLKADISKLLETLRLHGALCKQPDIYGPSNLLGLSKYIS